jgi:hypothetical protein
MRGINGWGRPFLSLEQNATTSIPSLPDQLPLTATDTGSPADPNFANDATPRHLGSSTQSQLSLGLRERSAQDPISFYREITPCHYNHHTQLTADSVGNWTNSVSCAIPTERSVVAALAHSRRYPNIPVPVHDVDNLTCLDTGLKLALFSMGNQWSVDDYKIGEERTLCGLTVSAVSRGSPTVSAEIHFCERGVGRGSIPCEAKGEELNLLSADTPSSDQTWI